MATRSTISLKIKETDLGKTMHFDVNNIPFGCKYSKECIDKVGDVTPSKSYLTIYHHWDGYPQGVGKTLVERYNTYESVLNLMLGGDASSINGEEIVQYCAWRGESWEHVQPLQQDNVCLTEEYAYKFEDGKWYVLGVEDEKGWVDLETYLVTHPDD